MLRHEGKIEMRPKYKPLYLQVMESIRRKIQRGEYDSQDTLPSEAEFAREYRVSISTVRQAISVLASEDMVEKKQGKGTYISCKRKVLRFFTWLTEHPGSRVLLEKIISLVEERYPFMEIQLVPTTYTGAREELQRLIASGRAPDIAHIVSHWTGEFAAIEALVNLEELLPAESLGMRSQELDLQGGRFAGKLYSLSWGLCPLVLLANMDLLRRYGISEVSDILTLAEWAEICAKIYRDSTGEVYGYGLPYNDGEADFLRLYPFMQAFGGRLLTAEGEFVLRSAENVRAFKWLQQFCSGGQVVFDTVLKIREMFAQNRLVFMHDGPWAKLWLEEAAGANFEQKYKALLCPVVTRERGRGVSKSWNYNHALAVLAQSENIGLAAKFIEAVSMDPEISSYYYSHSGHLPVSSSMRDGVCVTSEFSRVFCAQLKGAELLNAGNIYFPKAIDFCVDAVHNIFRRKVNVASELAEKQHYLEILYGY